LTGIILTGLFLLITNSALLVCDWHQEKCFYLNMLCLYSTNMKWQIIFNQLLTSMEEL